MLMTEQDHFALFVCVCAYLLEKWEKKNIKKLLKKTKQNKRLKFKVYSK